MEQGHEKGSAFAICTDSFKKAGKPVFVGESEKQKLHLFCESFKLEGNKVSGVAIHPKRIFHPEEDMTHVYLREELEKAAPTGAGKPFGIDHIYVLPPPNLLTKSWYCPEEDGICFEGLVDDYIAEQIRKKVFKGISIELKWLRPGGSVEYVNGVAARNFELTSVHFLKKYPPGDPDAYVKLWEQIKEQLVVAPPLTLDQRVEALEQQIQEVLNKISVINAKLEVLTGQPSPSATAQPAQSGASQTIGVMKMSESNQEPEKDEHGCIVGKERWNPETEKCVPIIAEQQSNQEPEKDEHGCIIGKERWDPDQNKCVPIISEQQEPEKDEHGCVVGKERWDAESEECVPIETVKEQQGEETDEHKQFMAQCLASGKTMEQCAAEWKQKQEGGETQGAQTESLVALRKKLVEVEAALTTMEKQQKRKAASWKEKYERLREAVKGSIPPPRIWKSWTPGPQRYVQENLKILREMES
jgi:hypothetical protein